MSCRVIGLIRTTCLVVLLAGIQMLTVPTAAWGQVTPDSVVGCYEMTIDGHLEYELPPRHFSLSSQQGTDDFERNNYIIRPVRASSSGHYEWALWRPLGRDSVLMVWTSGFEVTRLRVVVRGDTLRGKIVQSDDVIIEGERNPEANVLVVRTECS